MKWIFLMLFFWTSFSFAQNNPLKVKAGKYTVTVSESNSLEVWEINGEKAQIIQTLSQGEHYDLKYKPSLISFCAEKNHIIVFSNTEQKILVFALDAYAGSLLWHETQEVNALF